MSEIYDADIENLLSQCMPASLLIVGGGLKVIEDHYLEQLRVLGKHCEICRLHDASELARLESRFDMGIVNDTLEHCDKSEGLGFLARLRDLVTARFCVIVRCGDWPNLQSHWKPVDFYGLGMSQMNRYSDSTPGEPVRETHVYTYDIASYKPKPEWFGSENWANPELWNKYRW